MPYEPHARKPQGLELGLERTNRFSVISLRDPFPVAKDSSVVLDEKFYSSSGRNPVEGLGAGDSALLLGVAGDDLFAKVLRLVYPQQPPPPPSAHSPRP